MSETVDTAEAIKAGLNNKMAKLGKRVDGFLTRRIDGAKSMLHNVEEKKDEITSKLLEPGLSLTRASAPEAMADKEEPDSMKTQVVERVDEFLSRRIEGAKSLLHNMEEKKDEIFSKGSGSADSALKLSKSAENQESRVSNILSSLAHMSASANSTPEAKERKKTHELPESKEKQPLVVVPAQRVVQTTPWWQSCCGILDVLKSSDR